MPPGGNNYDLKPSKEPDLLGGTMGGENPRDLAKEFGDWRALNEDVKGRSSIAAFRPRPRMTSRRALARDRPRAVPPRRRPTGRLPAPGPREAARAAGFDADAGWRILAYPGGFTLEAWRGGRWPAPRV